MISKFRIQTADIVIRIMRCICCRSLHPTVTAQHHLVLLHSGRNPHIFVRSPLASRSRVLKSVSRLTTIQSTKSVDGTLSQSITATDSGLLVTRFSHHHYFLQFIFSLLLFLREFLLSFLYLILPRSFFFSESHKLRGVQ